MALILLRGLEMKAQAPTSTYLLGVTDSVVATPTSSSTQVRSERASHGAWPWRAWLTLVALPVALLAGLMWRYGVNVPHFDEWIATSPLFEKYAAGSLGVGEFFVRNNEHRLVVPKLVFFLTGLLTHWNTRVETFLTLLVLVGISANCWQLLRVTGWKDTPSARGLFLFLAALTFSTVQRENLLWGFQFHFVLSVFFLTAMAWLVNALPGPRGFVAAMILSTAATYSMASGFACWFFAVPMLWSMGGNVQRKWWVSYTLVGIAMVGMCFAGFERPEHHPSLATVLKTPWDGAAYFMAYLGGPFAHGLADPAKDVAPWIGVILCGGFCAVSLGVWRGRSDAPFLRKALPWLMISGFGLANAAITMVGRLGFGVSQALESRYSTYALLVPLGLAPVAALLVARWPRYGAIDRAFGRGLVAAFAGAALLLLWLSQLQLFPDWAVRRRTMLLEKSLMQMARCVDEPRLLRTYVTPHVAAFRGSVEALDDLGWLQPRPLAAPEIASIGDPAAPADPASGAIQRQEQQSSACTLYGWAMLPEAVEPAHAVLVTYDDPARGPVIFALARLNVKRADLAAATGEPAYMDSGWAIEFPRTKLPTGAQVVKAWAYDAELGRAWRLAGEMQVAP